MGLRSVGRHQVGIFVFDAVTLLDVAGPAEVWVEANRYGADYQVRLYSADGESVRSSTGVVLGVDGAVAAAPRLDTLIVPGADALAVNGVEPELVTAVSALAARSERVVSVCAGAFLLAATGRLDGHRATTHWRHAEALSRRHPSVTVEPDSIYVIDGAVATSAGVTAGIDLSLALVERDHGSDVAREVARSLVVFMQRPGGQSQFSVASRTPRPRYQPLRELLDAIATDPAGDFSVTRLAEAAGLSARQLTRLFHRELDTTPARHVERVRLEAAQALLDSGHSVGSTATRSGFGSEENLRRAFITHLGVPPRTYQLRFRTTAPTRAPA